MDLPMNIHDIERLKFDGTWCIDDVTVKCARPEPIRVIFSTDEFWNEKHTTWAALPPVKNQLEILRHVCSLRKDFLKRNRKLIQRECSTVMEDTDYGEPLDIDIQKIEKYYSVDHIYIPRVSRSGILNFVIMADCVWEDEHGLGIQCRGDKVIKVGKQHDFF